MHTRRGQKATQPLGGIMTYANDITTSNGVAPDAEEEEFDAADYDDELSPEDEDEAEDDDEEEWDDDDDNEEEDEEADK
jgi:hypothetical protein